MKTKTSSRWTRFALGLAAAVAILALPGARPARAGNGYVTKIYNDLGGNRLNVASGGKILVLSGGTIDVSAGTLTLAAGQINVSSLTGVLPAANGGSGANLGSAAAGAVPYFSATGVESALAAGSATQVLIGGASAPAWSGSPQLASLGLGAAPVANVPLYVQQAGALAPTGFALQVATSTAVNMFGVTNAGHLIVDQVLAPSGSSNCAVQSGSSDVAGQVVISGGSTSTCTITFAQPFASAPFCLAADGSSTTSTVQTAATTAHVVLTLSSSRNDTLQYFCISQ